MTDEEAHRLLLEPQKRPVEKALEEIVKIPLYVKFTAPDGRRAVEFGIKIKF